MNPGAPGLASETWVSRMPAPEHQALLAALLLEKASYELLYELNNRPTWLNIPLKGLLSIARNSA